jgi:hypothetical protein
MSGSTAIINLSIVLEIFDRRQRASPRLVPELAPFVAPALAEGHDAGRPYSASSGAAASCCVR